MVMLRGSQRWACPRGRCDGQPAQGRDGSGWPCPRAGPRAVAARVPVTGPGPRHAGTGPGKPGRYLDDLAPGGVRAAPDCA